MSASIGRFLPRALAAAAIVFVAACSQGEGDRCEATSDCDDGLVCIKTNSEQSGTCGVQTVTGQDAAPSDAPRDVPEVSPAGDAAGEGGGDAPDAGAADAARDGDAAAAADVASDLVEAEAPAAEVAADLAALDAAGQGD